ncbi:ArsR family transcriptional regulator [Candidatus Woesearchaeota archaeon]|nr:MAG: ArsR family transcriptional regulator [Candidatus Woesearchaeota archaeon]
MKYCVYYEEKTYRILDYLPKGMDPAMINQINEFWNQDICRKMLITISEMEVTSIPQLKKIIGHSMSTLHDNIEKLSQAGLLETELTYVGNKKRNLIPTILFITKNPKFKIQFKKFFQGLWIDSKKTQQVIDFLQKHHGHYYSIEEISAKTRIPVDEIEMLLGNWDSLTTRTLSNVMKERPFEKKVMYKGKKA